jgi:hypothetical protein
MKLGLSESDAKAIASKYELQEARELIRSQALKEGPGHWELNNLIGEENAKAFRAIINTPEGLERMWRADTVMALRSAPSRGIVKNAEGKFRLTAWEYLDYLEIPAMEDVGSLVNFIEYRIPLGTPVKDMLGEAIKFYIEGSADFCTITEWLTTPQARGKLKALDQWCVVIQSEKGRKRTEE